MAHQAYRPPTNIHQAVLLLTAVVSPVLPQKITNLYVLHVLLCSHGDLKAGNVLLTANPTPGSSSSCSDRFSNSLKVWKRADSPALSAKVADFGMSLPLGPTDTHATMLARVRNAARVAVRSYLPVPILLMLLLHAAVVTSPM